MKQLFYLPILISCGGGLGVSPDDIASIRVEPSEVTLSARSDLPGTQNFVAYATLNNGDELPLDLVSWQSSNLSAGNINGDGEFQTVVTNGGVTNIIAKHFGVEGQATVRVIYKEDILTEGVSSDVISQFVNASEDVSLDMIYPDDGVTVPRNLDGLGFKWNDPSLDDSTVYRIRFQTEITDISVYTDTDYWVSSTDLWELISAANRKGAVNVDLYAGQWNNGSLSNVRDGDSISLVVNRLDARGSVLYWAGESDECQSNTGSTGGGMGMGMGGQNQGVVMRIPFGTTQAESFIINSVGSANNGSGQGGNSGNSSCGCIGCHSLSDEADKLVVTHSGVNGMFSVYDISDIESPVQTVMTNNRVRATFKTISPDGRFLMGFYNGCEILPNGNMNCSNMLHRATLYSMEDGQALTYWDFNFTISHPDWSPDGTQIVFVRAKGDVRSDMEFSGGEIIQMDIDPDAQTFGNMNVLKSQSQAINHYYPSYSPDGDWIAYNRASNSAPELCKSAPDAEVWLMSRDGSIDIRLDNANSEGNIKNSYPRWGPLPDDDVLWLAFSSVRSYPLRATIDMDVDDDLPPDTQGGGGGLGTPQKPQIWVAAIQPELAKLGQDPSSTAFWLPGQQSTTDNHLPVWWSK